MKKSILFLSFVIFSFAAFSQTKRIAHRSHSGKDIEFNINSEDNFGLPPSRKAKTDSLKTTDSSKAKVIADKKLITKAKRKKPAQKK